MNFVSRPRTESPGAPLLDEHVFHEILGELGDVHAREMMQMVERDARKRLLALVDCVARRDRRAIHVHAHALAGLLGHFGLARAALCARALEAGPQEGAASLGALQMACDQAFLVVAIRLVQDPKRAA